MCSVSGPNNRFEVDKSEPNSQGSIVAALYSQIKSNKLKVTAAIEAVEQAQWTEKNIFFFTS